MPYDQKNSKALAVLYQHFDGQYVPLLASLSWSIVVGIVSFVLVYKTRLFNQLLVVPLSAPFLALPALIFAFLMGFMSAEAWQNFSNARSALINETSAISRLVNIPVQPPEYQARSIALLKTYLQTSLSDEWAGEHNQVTSDKASDSINQLEVNVWDARKQCAQSTTTYSAACMDSIATSAFIKGIDDLRSAREQRLSAGYEIGITYKWSLVIFLAFIAALSVAAAHRQSQKTGVIALILFCLSLWVAFSMVSLHINPYKGRQSVVPTPLVHLLETLDKAPNTGS